MNAYQSKIYIASSLLNHERVINIKNILLHTYSIGLTYDWTPHAEGVISGNPETDPEKLQQIAYDEFQGVISAAAVLIIMPGRTGTHFEYGLAYALQKPIVYLDDHNPENKRRFEPIHFLENVEYCSDQDSALSEIVAIVDNQKPIHPMERLKCL